MANYISEKIGILDLNGSEGMLSVEGSPIIRNERLVGIRLPNLHNRLYATSFSFFTPITSLFEKPQKETKMEKLESINTQVNPNFVVKVECISIDGKLSSSGVLIDKQKGLILTNAHSIEQDFPDQDNIYVTFYDDGEPIRMKAKLVV